jgi:hypothetical protein
MVEIGGAFFTFSSNESINATSWSAIASASNAYLALTPSGTAGSQIVTASWVTDTPIWSESKQGWYSSAASIIRVIGAAYKVTATQQEKKSLFGQCKFQGKVDLLTSGSGSWIVPGGVLRLLVSCVGGGGGGGGADTDATAYANGGGGGGTIICAGLKQEMNVIPGQSISYSVGAGGLGSASGASPSAGGDGGNSTFGSLVGYGGGGGGRGTSGAGIGGTGAAGGFGACGDTPPYDSGVHVGGGGGGAGGRGATVNNVATAGGYGGGGGGACGQVVGSGANGGSGIIIIEY